MSIRPLRLVLAGAATGCTGPVVPTPTVPGPPVPEERPWQGPVRALDTSPCLVDQVGDLYCQSVHDLHPAYTAGPYIDLPTVYGDGLHALRADGSVHDLVCLYVGACGRFDEPLVALASNEHGIRADGSMLYAGDRFGDGTDWLINEQGPPVAYRNGRIRSLLHPDFMVGDFQPVGVAPMTSGACAIDAAGAIRCYGPMEPRIGFDSPPYRQLRGHMNGACAVREADGLVHCFECTTFEATVCGLEHVLDLGEVAELAVGFRNGLGVCATSPEGDLTCWSRYGYYDDAGPWVQIGGIVESHDRL